MTEEAEEEDITPPFQWMDFIYPKRLFERMEKHVFCRLRKKKHDLKKAEKGVRLRTERSNTKLLGSYGKQKCEVFDWV